MGRSIWGIGFVLLLGQLTGCATILSDRSFPVTIDNSGGPTYFTIVDKDNHVVESGLTPQQVILKSSAGPFRPAHYRVVYAGAGGAQQQVLETEINWWTAGNVIIGGVPGVAIDAATGALWRLEKNVTGHIPPEQLVSDARHGSAIIAETQGNPLPQTSHVTPASYEGEKGTQE